MNDLFDGIRKLVNELGDVLHINKTIEKLTPDDYIVLKYLDTNGKSYIYEIEKCITFQNRLSDLYDVLFDLSEKKLIYIGIEKTEYSILTYYQITYKGQKVIEKNEV